MEGMVASSLCQTWNEGVWLSVRLITGGRACHAIRPFHCKHLSCTSGSNFDLFVVEKKSETVKLALSHKQGGGHYSNPTVEMQIQIYVIKMKKALLSSPSLAPWCTEPAFTRGSYSDLPSSVCECRPQSHT